MVKISIFCTFSRTPPRVFIRSSSKLGRMCRINIQKNVLSRNFEFFAQLIFSWGQTLKKVKKSKTRYFFANQMSQNVSYGEDKNPIILYLQSEFKNICFWPKNAIIYANFYINSKNTLFYQSFAPFY